MAQRETGQRDDEDQPEDADLGAAVQLENAETLDGSAGGADALDAGYVPPDRPYGLDEDAVTGAGMREGDTLDERLARERPDGPEGDPDRSGRLTIAGEGAAMETSDATEGVDVGVDGGAASAEEAAVHDVQADTRVDGEPSVAGAPQLSDPEVEATLSDDSPASEQARLDAARDVARTLDDSADAAGAAAAASGRGDVGPGSGL
ncbi:MAG: DUF5709 domain-containing protein [Pseudonocardia sp.]|nr:DUF5709 domain-containing protein [Pseudonocardia sp.]